jgi:hypothetical protein
MNPGFCKAPATQETLVRCTPAFALKILALIASCWNPEITQSQKPPHMRASTVWLALQPGDCCACAIPALDGRFTAAQPEFFILSQSGERSVVG